MRTKLTLQSLSLILCLTLAATLGADAQQPAPPGRITGTFSHITLDSLVTRIEATVPVHFFYDSVLFDSLAIDLEVTNATLDQVLHHNGWLGVRSTDRTLLPVPGGGS